MTPAELILTLARLGLSQARAARVLDVSEATVSRWIAGKQPCTGPAVVALRLLMQQQDR